MDFIFENESERCHCSDDIFQAVGAEEDCPGICKECLNRLLDLEEDPNLRERNEYGWAPLHYAAFENDLEGAEILIKRGADINIQNGFGETPLHVAAIHRNAEIAKFLIECGANVDAVIPQSGIKFLDCFRDAQLTAEFTQIVEELNAFDVKTPDC
jgi:ankyrin repeat protein